MHARQDETPSHSRAHHGRDCETQGARLGQGGLKGSRLTSSAWGREGEPCVLRAKGVVLRRCLGPTTAKSPIAAAFDRCSLLSFASASFAISSSLAAIFACRASRPAPRPVASMRRLLNTGGCSSAKNYVARGRLPRYGAVVSQMSSGWAVHYFDPQLGRARASGPFSSLVEAVSFAETYERQGRVVRFLATPHGKMHWPLSKRPPGVNGRHIC